MKQLILPLILSPLLFAQCTLMQEREAKRIWTESIHHENNPNKKLNLLIESSDVCNLEVVSIDLQILMAQADEGTSKALSKQQLINLNEKNSQLVDVSQEHIDNNAKKINTLLGISYENTLKSLESIGGSYQSDLKFDQGSYVLKENHNLNDVLTKIDEILSSNPEALFVFEGGASSEGNAIYNKRLAKNRANELKKRIPANYKSNIKVFSNGEQQLVCQGGFLPEKNSHGEYSCITKEDREASRRVSIRREI